MVEVEEFMEEWVEGGTCSVGVLIARRRVVPGWWWFVDDKAEQVIHVPEREEVIRKVGMVASQEVVEAVLIVRTVHYREGRAEGTAHGDANGLAQEVAAGSEVDITEVELDDGHDVILSEVEAVLMVGAAVSESRRFSFILGDHDSSFYYTISILILY